MTNVIARATNDKGQVVEMAGERQSVWPFEIFAFNVFVDGKPQEPIRSEFSIAAGLFFEACRIQEGE